MSSLHLSSLCSGSAAGLVLVLAGGSTLLLPSASLAGGPAISPCQKTALVNPGTEALLPSEAPLNGSLLAQAAPVQPVGAELGEPACTYDPVVPTKPQIIRGLW